MTMGATSVARGQNGDVPAADDDAAAVAAAGVVAVLIDDDAIVAAAAVMAAGPRTRTLGGACIGGCSLMTDPPSFLERENKITTLCHFVFFLSNNKFILVTSCDSQKKGLTICTPNEFVPIFIFGLRSFFLVLYLKTVFIL